MFDAIRFAKRLIDLPSPTESEFDVAVFLHDELAALGYACRKQPVSERRFNVYASAGGKPRVILNSHIDTVPPWIAAREDSDFLYGRGACDTKGIIAAMVAAGERLRADGISDFAYLFVVGEETDSIGAKMANREFAGLASDFVVVGEPTESIFARASKGALTCFIRFDGVAGHSAYPERGDSAINKMVAAIAEINATRWGSHDDLGETTVNVGVVRGGEKPNVIPAEAECQLIFRTVTDPEEVQARLQTILARHDGTITVSRGNPPQFMRVPEGAPSRVVAFNSDIPHLSALGAPLLFGPGSILDAHGANEKIGKRELLDSVQTYVDTVIDLCRS
ncbi:MAG TPA: M20/M25/M40 family metallo-hydrolase [Thermoanaerobaculia bacterium]|jgi:acetylornithine deacetylase|nr:M20/M25/M40 family metallo-hydrolase [Thermoanaerobaculia bacterium]